MDEYTIDGEEPFVFRLNDNGTGPSLLVKVCAERGWRMYQGSSSGLEEGWNLWWRSGAFPSSHHKTLTNWQFMNHIPKGGSICRKDNLSRLLRCMRKIYGSIYDFSPPGFLLPLEYAKLVTECSRLRRHSEENEMDRVVWIHKPVAQSQGRGIFLFRSLCDVRCGNASVVQRYIERPLLIAGYKFDLRLYVCVPCYKPLVAYMYAEGLVRFGTDKYTLSDLHNPYRHLTNSSLNKLGPRYDECKDRIGNGCKWTLKQLRRQLSGRLGRRGASEGASEWFLWQRIRGLVALTLLAQATGTPPTRNCFEFYGFDVLIDDNLKPWLLEVNLSPALGADCEADVSVKKPMLHELFDLLGLPMRHTGLSLLAAPTTQQSISSSDDETSGGCSTPVRVDKPDDRTKTTAAPNRNTHKRREMSIHRVTIQPPDLPREKAVRIRRDVKTAPQCRQDDINESPVKTTGGDLDTPVSFEERSDNTGTAGCKKRQSFGTTRWGNGVEWDKAPGKIGLWVRIYPHTSKAEKVGGDDIREGVAQVCRFLKASRDVVKDTTKELTARPRNLSYCNEDYLERSLRSKLRADKSFQLWLPPTT